MDFPVTLLWALRKYPALKYGKVEKEVSHKEKKNIFYSFRALGGG